MLAFLGLLTVIAVLVLITTRRLTALVALIIVPVASALIAGFGLRTSGFAVDGIQQTAPVAAVFLFAILYFGVMTDAGMLDPIVDRILRSVGTRPTRIVMGSALLALLVHLDGSGAVTFLVTIPAMLPPYERLGMDKRILAAVASPGSRYSPHWNQLDFGIRRTFRFGGTRMIQAQVDLFNALNSNAILTEGTSLTSSAAPFISPDPDAGGTPLTILQPRLIRIGAQIRF